MSDKRCSAADCDRAVYARELCGRHYEQQQRQGTSSPTVHPPSAQSRAAPAERSPRAGATGTPCAGHAPATYALPTRCDARSATGAPSPTARGGTTAAATAARTRTDFASTVTCTPAARCVSTPVVARSATATGTSPCPPTGVDSSHRVEPRSSSTGWSWRRNWDVLWPLMKPSITGTATASTTALRTWSCGAPPGPRVSASATSSSGAVLHRALLDARWR